MKRVEPDDSAKRVEPSQEWPPGLFEEIVDLLAEALVLDYQRIRGDTVNSPRGFRQTWDCRIFVSCRR